MKIIVLTFVLIINAFNISVCQNEIIYDSNKRLLKVIYGDSIEIEYCYDELGNRTCYNIISDVQLTPDLYIQNGSSSNINLCQNSSFTITYDMENIGTGNAGGFFTKYYLSADLILDGQDVLMESLFSTGAASGIVEMKTIELGLPMNTAVGDYYVLVLIDSESNVTELSESNNQLEIMIAVNDQEGFDFLSSATNATCNDANGSISIFDIDGTPPFSFEWSHDENLNSSEADGLSPGAYYFTITDGNGCSEVGYDEVLNESNLPATSFGYSVTGDTVFFLNTSLNGEVYLWDFGEGSTSTEMNPIHIYGEIDVYEVCLSATNECGESNVCLNVNLNFDPGVNDCGDFIFENKEDDFLMSYSLNDSIKRGIQILYLNDNSLLVISKNESNTGKDFNISKFDLEGNIIQSNTYSTIGQDYFYELKQDIEGRVFFCGYTDSYGNGGLDGWFAELDMCGEIIWSKVYGGNGTDVINDFEFLDNGNIICAGRIESYGSGDADVWILEIDKLGNVIWSKSYGGANYERAYGITVAEGFTDLEYVIVGRAHDHPQPGDRSGLFMTLDSTGNLLNKYTFYDQSQYSDHLYFRDVMQTTYENNSESFAAIGYSADGEIGGNGIFGAHGIVAVFDRYGSDSKAISLSGFDQSSSFVKNENDHYIVCSGERITKLNTLLEPEKSIYFGLTGGNNSRDLNLNSQDYYVLANHNNPFIYSFDSSLTIGCYADTVNVHIAEVGQYLAKSSSGTFTTMDITNQINELLYTSLFKQNAFPSTNMLCPNEYCSIEVTLNNIVSTICQGETILFSANVKDASKVSWFVNDSLYSSGLSCQLSFDSIYDHTVKIIAENGICSVVDSFIVEVGEFSEDIELMITGSNPTDLFLADGSISLSVLNSPSAYDVLWSNGDTTNNITDLKSGLYTVTVTYNDLCDVIESFTLFDEALILEDTLPRFSFMVFDEDDNQLGFNVIDTVNESSFIVANSASIAKLDHYGRIIWIKEHNINAEIRRILVHSDHSITICFNATIAHFDSFGNHLWSKSFSNSANATNPNFEDLAILNDSLIIAVGDVYGINVDGDNSNETLAYAVCYNIQGDLKWSSSRGDDNHPTGYKSVKIHGQKIVIAGFYWTRILIDEFNLAGSINNSYIYRLKSSSWSYNAKELAIYPNGDKIVYFEGGREGFVKISANGNNVLWHNFFHTNIPEFDEIRVNQLFVTDSSIIANIRVFPELDPGWKNGILEMDNNGNDIYSKYFQGITYGDMTFDKNGSIINCGNKLNKTKLGENQCIIDDFEINWYAVSYFEDFQFNPLTHNSNIVVTDFDANSNLINATTVLDCPDCSDLIDTIFPLASYYCIDDTLSFNIPENAMAISYWNLNGCQMAKDTNDFSFIPDQNGTFELMIIGHAGICFDTIVTTIQVGNPLIDLYLGPDVSICGEHEIISNNDSLDIWWSTSEVSNSITVNQSGWYSASIVDDQGCTYSDSTFIEILPSLSVNILKKDNDCNGNGSIVIDVDSGKEPYSYSWSNGAIGNNLSALTAGTYLVTVSDAGICSEVKSMDINNISPNVILEYEDIYCYSDSLVEVTAIISNNAQEYVSYFSNGDTSEIVNGIGIGSYFHVYSGVNDCEIFTPFLIGDKDIFEIDSIDACPFDSTSIVLNDTINLNSNYFSWSTGENGFNVTVSPEESALYIVVYNDGIINCTDEIFIDVNDDINYQLDITHPSCPEASDGQVTLDVQDPLNHGYSINWSDPNPVSAGNYSVTITDATTGCDFIEAFQLVDPAPVMVQIAKENISACSSADGTATAVVIGGTLPYLYQWSLPGETTTTIAGLDLGMYSVTVTDQNGCFGIDTVTIEPYSGTVIWIGESASWQNLINWDKGHAPEACEDVILRSSLGLPVTVTLDENYTSSIRSLKIEENVSLITNGQLTIFDSDAEGIEVNSEAYLTINGTIDISQVELESILCYGNIVNNGTINITDTDPTIKLGESCDFEILGAGIVNIVKE